MEPRKITEETLAAFARQLGEEERSPATLETVSYTHLTLPTICSV